MGNANSGKRPKPTNLKLLQGNPGKRPLNLEEPKVPQGPVVKPATLSVGAGVVWDEVAPVLLYMGTLTAADVWAFAAYCELQSTFTRNAQLKDSSGFDVRLEGDVANKLRPFYDYFGMTPTGRARIHLPKPKDEPAAKWAGSLS